MMNKNIQVLQTCLKQRLLICLTAILWMVTARAGDKNGFIHTVNAKVSSGPAAVFTWTGAVSTDYNTAGNWDAGTVPTATDDIVIATSTPNYCAVSSGTVTVNNIIIQGTGDLRLSAGVTFIIANNINFTSSINPTLDCASTVVFGKAGALTIPAWQYGNLTCANNTVRTWSVGTTGICNAFTPGTGTLYTATVGSTVDYSSGASQTIRSVKYYNLTNSGNGPRSYMNTNDTIDIAGTFVPTTGAITTGSANTIYFSSAALQTVPTTVYYNLRGLAGAPRILATSGANGGVITIKNFFGILSALTTINSTVEFAGANIYLMAGGTYHHLIFNGTGSSSYSIASGTALTVTGNLTIKSSGTSCTLNIGNIAGVATSLNVTGNVDVQDKGILQMVTVAGSLGATANIAGNLTVSGTGKINLEPVASATAAGIINVTGSFTSTGTNLAVAGVGGIVDWGVTGTLTNNGIYLKGNFNHSGTGTFGASSSTAATPAAGFVFNSTSGTQTFSYTGPVSVKTNYQVNAAAKLQLLTDLTLGAGASPASVFTLSGTLDCGSFSVNASDASNAFVINTNAVLRTEHVNGVTGSLSGFAAGKITGNNGIYQFAGISQNTGFPASITAANGLDWLGTGSLSLNHSFDINNPGNINYTGTGLFYLADNNLSIGSGAVINGGPFSATKMFVTGNGGHLMRNFTAAGAGLPFTWPVGDTTGTTEYTPVTVNSVTASSAGTFGFGVVDAVHPGMAPVTSYISRYWTYYSTGGTYSWGNAVFVYVADDIIDGPESLFKAGTWNGSSWTIHTTSSGGGNTLTVSSGPTSANLFTNSDITARASGPVYYRSAAAGPNDWNALPSWQVSTDPLFVSPAPVVPLVTPTAANSGGIVVRTGHTMVITGDENADELAIASGGTLNVNSGASLTIYDGAGTDATVSGTLNNLAGATINTNAASLVSVVSGGYLKNSADINAAGTFDITGTYEHHIDGNAVPAATWNTGALCYITGVTAAVPAGLGQNFYDLTWDCSQLGDLDLLNAVSGSVQNDFTVSKTNGFALRLANTQTVNLSIGRDLRITGGKLVMNGGNASFVTPASSLHIGRNLLVSGTGFFSNTDEYASGAAVPTVNVAADLSVTAGAGQRLVIAGAKAGFAASPSSATINVGGSFSLTGNGTFTLSESAAAGTMNVAGNFTHTNGIIEKNAGTGTIIFNGTVPQIYTSGGTIATAVDFIVASNAILDMNTSYISGTGSFTMQNNSTLRMGSADGIVTASTILGNLRNSGTRLLPSQASYVYNGTVAQNTGTGLPANISGDLTIDNTGTSPADVVTLTNNNTVTAVLNLNAGKFNAGTANTLLITGGGVVNGNGGSQDLAGTATDNIIRFTANGAVTGSPELFNVTIGNSVTGVDFTGNARINGNLLINNGGFVSPNAPRYAVGATLIYNTGGSYVRNVEWGSNTAGAPSYPHHVLIRNGSTLIFNGSTPADIGCGGDVTIGNPAGADGGTLDLTAIGGISLHVGGSMIIGGSVAAGSLLFSNSFGGDIYIGANWTRTANGTVNFGAGNGRAVFFDGNSNGTVTAAGGEVFPYMYLNKATKTARLTLADNLSVTDEVAFTQGTLDLGTNNKFFTIVSTAAKTARVAPSSLNNTAFIYGASDNLGQFIMQRYFPDRRSWRLVAAPLKPGGGTHSIAQAWQEHTTGLDYTAANWAASVAADTISAGYGTQITGGSMANGFDLSPTNKSSIKYFNGGSWYTPPTTNTTSVNSQEGWLLFVRGDRKNFGEITDQFKTPTTTTLRPRGQLFIGPKSVTSSNITTVGNPYPSAVDYVTMIRTGAGWPAQPTYYVWDPMLGGSMGVGAFVALTWNGVSFTRSAPLTGTGTSSFDDRYIPSGAAILVDFPSGGGTLTIDETDKSTANTTNAFRPAAPVYQLMTILRTVNADGSDFVSDAALNLFDNGFNNEADNNDVRKLSNVNENIALQRNGSILTIERTQLPHAGDTIFYFMNRMQQKKYRFEFVPAYVRALPGKTVAYLEDVYLKKKTRVSMTGKTIIDFLVTADSGSFAANRFRLVFTNTAFQPATILFVHEEKDKALIKWAVNEPGNGVQYAIERSEDSLGFKAVTGDIATGNEDTNREYYHADGELHPGEYYYRIKCVNTDGEVAYSEPVKLKAGHDRSFSVFPNPVVNNSIRLQLQNVAAGNYKVQVRSNNGALLFTAQLNHTGGSATKTFQPSTVLAAGLYELTVTEQKGKVHVVPLVIATP